MKIKRKFTKTYLNFKFWKHKAYSVFNTLKKEIRICILPLSYFICFACHLTFAGNTSDSINSKIRLDEIKISASRNNSLYSDVGRFVTLLSRREIELLPVQSVADLLRFVVGFDIRERGPFGVQSDISLRGGSHDQVMILLNGINIGDPQTGHHALNLPIDLNSIERVEILRGPAARVYGPNAFSGAVNFVTATNEADQLRLKGMVGEHGLLNAGASISKNLQSFGNNFSISKKSSEGYISNTDFDEINIFYHGEFSFSGEKLSFQTGFTNKAFGANSFYSDTYPNQFEQIKTRFHSLTFESDKAVKLSSRVYWRRHYDRFELFRDGLNADSWYDNHNYHLTDIFGGGMNLAIPWVLGTTSLGVELRGESVWSNVLGYDIDSVAFKLVVGEKDIFYTRQYHRHNSSLFFEHTYIKNRISLSGGLLLNNSSQLGYGFTLFPGIDISYWLTTNLKWLASYNKSLRLPTFTDMFYDGPDIAGNIHSKAEESDTFETGFRFINNWLNFQAGGFYRKGRNLIDWGRQPGDSRYTIYNLERVDTYGLEYTSNFLPSELFNFKIIKNINLSFFYLWQNENINEEYESRYVLVPLRYKLNLGLEHESGLKGLTFNWHVRYHERYGSYYKSSDNQMVKYAAVYLTDIRITWRRSNYRFYSEARNLFNKSYSDMGELIQPGRWLSFGFETDLKF